MEFGIPWVADLRDPWTDIYYYRQFYPTWLAHRYNLRLEKTILEKSSIALTVSPSLKDLFSKKINSSNDKVKVITNGFDPDDFKDLPAVPANKKFVITYVGTMSDIYPLEPFIDAFKRFTKKHEGAILRFIGTVSPEHTKRLTSVQKKNIELIPYVDHRRAIEYMSESTALLLIIPSNKNNKGIVTGKLFEYMAVKRPILLLGPEDGDAADLIRQSKAGAIIEPGNSDKILETLDEWKSRVPDIKSDERYSRKQLTKQLVEILDSLTNQ